MKVLTGSTNFSVTGLYVNSNHVLIFDDPKIAATYSGVFNEAWDDDVKAGNFLKSQWSTQSFPFPKTQRMPKMEITFAPHSKQYAAALLDGVSARIAKEGKQKNGSVVFAVMELDNGTSPVYTALKALHKKQAIFTYGISDNPGGIALYPLSTKTGVLVTGKPVNTQLPPPFDQVRNVGGVGHQIHHKFVVCGFNGKDPVVYCGSSNLALGGEASNSDNLIAIYDQDIATVFAIEALGLVDHFNFLDSVAQGSKSKATSKGRKRPKPAAAKTQAAVSAGWFLGTSDAWAAKYFDTKSLHYVDRLLFA